MDATSQILKKYKRVHTGVLTTPDSVLLQVNQWFKRNLYYYSSSNTKIIPIGNDYLDGTFPSQTINYVCKKFKVTPRDKYEVMELGEATPKSIQDSFTMGKVFITNDAEKEQEQDYSTKRLMLVEHDFIHHPKYREIEPRIQEIKDQVCTYASRIRNNGRFMSAKVTVLYSKPGCIQQVLHKDDNNQKVGRNFVMSAIVALEEDTTLDLATRLYSQTRDCCKIAPGSFILFCGSQVHGGSSYQGPNLRLHFYLHEEMDILDTITDGSIHLNHYCEFEGCNFISNSTDYWQKHCKKVHGMEWWKMQKELKRPVRKNADGKYYCHAVPPCEYHCKDRSGMKKHYNKSHKTWWEKNKEKRGRKTINDEVTEKNNS